ncbi:hypothetical protein [Granulicella sp. L46]|uniref:hypothetical protein n=1 Tax=Granulicella sp. L46 TaxID=1641865 RepID=UPI00131C4F7F|nr:hypothetical protein [Granulicella sp. L46]
MAKRWFPVLCLLMASVGARAQGSGSFMQGVGLKIGFQAGDNVMIPNAPFQADFVVTMTDPLADGNVLNRETRGNVQRDSAGRFHEQSSEVTRDGKGIPHGSVQSIILDPVAKRMYQWSNTAKFLNTSPIRDGIHASIDYVSTADGREHLRNDVPNDVTTTDLGTKKIGVMSCVGTLVTTIVPAGKMGNEKPIVITDESWHSADLQMVVERVVHDPLIGVRKLEFENIRPSEPPLSAFQPPDGLPSKPDLLFSMPFRGTPPPAPGSTPTPRF